MGVGMMEVRLSMAKREASSNRIKGAGRYPFCEATHMRGDDAMAQPLPTRMLSQAEPAMAQPNGY